MNEAINLIAFVVGLGIGLLQLYVGQRHFESEQRDRMEEIRKSLTNIEQHVAVLREVTSQRAYDMQEKLISLAVREEAVAEITEEAKAEIQELIGSELRKAGVSEQQTAHLQTKVADTIQRSTQSVVEVVGDGLPSLTPRQQRVLELALQGSSVRETADELGIGITATRDLLEKVLRKSGVVSKEELRAKYGQPVDVAS